MKKVKEIYVSPAEIKQLLKKVEEQTLENNDYEIIKGALNTMIYIQELLLEKKMSIKRLKKIFGVKTESSKNILKDIEDEEDEEPEEDKHKKNGEDEKQNETANSEGDKNKEIKPKRKGGNGKNGAASYTGAEKIFVPHPSLKPYDRCPECPKGKIYDTNKPSPILRIKGNGILNATIYELQKFRCSSCGAVFTAEIPKEAGKEKYDESVGSIISIMKYGCGFPFYRLDKTQKNLGIPLPASTGWEIVEKVANIVEPVFNKLTSIAAQGDIIHNDDTKAKILSVIMERKKNTEKKDKSSRSGIFTTGFISKLNNIYIALFYTGKNHAGENMTMLLEKRATDKDPPIQMCDALSRNTSKIFKTILCNCLTHARRNIVDLYEHFPEECRFVIKQLGKVYYNDSIAKKKKMSPGERLSFHQERSSPLMEELRQWIEKQFEETKVEPNSSLGKAFQYFINHWEALTRFLEVPGAPLDNNIVERILKRVVLHRKNSYFYKTENGARVGDILMSIIETCCLGQVNPFDYLTILQKYRDEIIETPSGWMPWNYQTNLKS